MKKLSFFHTPFRYGLQPVECIGVSPNGEMETVSYTHLDVYKRQVVKPAQAAVVTRILEAIYQSAESGKTIYFE